MDPVVRYATRGVLWFLEHEPLLWRWKFTRFTRLSENDRTAFLNHWAESGWAPRRGAFLLLKVLVSFGFYSSPEVWKGIGYDRLCKPDGVP